MVTWTDWFNFSNIIVNYKALIGIISFGLVIIYSIVYQIMITGKVRKSKIKTNSFLSFRMLYVAIALITLSYFSEHFQRFLNIKLAPGNFLTGLSIIGYTIAITALNIFILRIVNFRSQVRIIIKILAYIETIVLSLVSLLYVITSFIDIGTPELTSTISDSSIIIFGFVVLGAAIFTIITLLVEARNNANKMVKLRLQMSALGTFGILLDGLTNILHVLFGTMGIDDSIYYLYSMPIMAALIFYLMATLAYYYTLFPPLWLQQSLGVLPPSFIDLMKKQSELKNMERTPQ
ncbi:MAG: hypothetical protein FK734_02095 [Asgard group archaeon]|nr:hypothetical protein [Asgard group archaeon]